MKAELTAALLAAAATGIGGCGQASVEPAPEKASPALEERFGENFAAMSRASANSEPRDVKANDLPPVSLTDEPIDF